MPVIAACSSVLEYPRHPQATFAVSRLVTEDPVLVKEAQVEIKSLGPGAMPALRDALSRCPPDKQIVILDLALSIGEPREVLEQIVSNVAKSPVPAIREMVPGRVATVASQPASLLAKMRGFTIPDTLRSLLSDESSAARLAALRALSKIDSKDAIPEASLTPLFHDPEQLVRVTAILIGAEQGYGFESPEQRDILAILQSALQDQRPIVRATSAKALGTLQGKSSAAVPALVLLIQSEQQQVVRLQIAIALSRIGSPAALAATIPVLRELSQNPDAPVRVAATAALARAEALSNGTMYSPPQPPAGPSSL
jgi:HEAT repeat protein